MLSPLVTTLLEGCSFEGRNQTKKTAFNYIIEDPEAIKKNFFFYRNVFIDEKNCLQHIVKICKAVGIS